MNSMIFPALLLLAYGLSSGYIINKSIKSNKDKIVLAIFVIGKATSYIAILTAFILICAAIFYK